jgi:hypothetical protein
MDEKLLKEAQDLGISPVGKTADELRAEIEERRKQTGDTKPSEPSRADTIVEELGERFLEDLNEAAKVRPRTSKEKREAREANPDFYAFQEGEMSGADRDKLQKSADAAGMSVEEYTGLSGLDRYAAKQVAPMQALAERRAKQASREIANPYDEEFVAGLSGPLGSPFELKRSLREENEKTRKEMEAAGASPEAIRAAMKSETEMSDAAQQRWKDLTTKGTVEDRRAYWTGAADRMKAEGRSVGTVTRMETPDGEVIAEREPNNGRMQWADGSVGGPADMSNPAFARSLETAQRSDESPQRAAVPVVYSGAGNNDPVVNALTGRQEMAFAPRPTVIEGEDGARAVSGIYGTGRTGGAKFTPEQEAQIAAARTPEGFAQTANGPVALKQDPLVAVQERERKEAEKKKIEEELKRRRNSLA